MKKYFLSIVALAGMLFATSCQESLVEPQVGGTTTFTVQVPDQMGTKAIGGHELVNKLYVEVYPQGATGNVIFETTADKKQDGSFEVSMNLIQDQHYSIIFWAQKEGAYDVRDLKNIPMNVNHHNNESGAAFYAYLGDFIPSGTTQTVTLKRPFAQLNLGTTPASLKTDVQSDSLKLSQSYIKVGNIAESFNTVNGCGEGSQPVEFSLANVPTEKLYVAGEMYYYVSMDYLPIAGDNQALVTVEAQINLTNNQSINHKFTNVPVRENYRTNIVGNLISSSTDFNVVVDDRFVDENGDNVSDDNNSWVVENAAAAQAALDNAKPGDVIELVAGVNYGILYLRPVKDSPATKEVDWIGNNYRWETYTLFENITILGAEGATVDAIKIEGGTYYNTEHSQKDKYPVMLSLIELKNVVIDGVTFTGKGGYDPQGYGNAINLSGSNIKVDGLTLKNCVLENADDNARLIYKTESTTAVHQYDYDGQTYTFTPSLKDITVTGTTFNGGYIGLELRETNNVTITDNVFNVGDRNILLASNSGCTYSGKVTITGNVSNNAEERFVRMSGAGDAVVVIKDNYIYNYQGADADYIKVTDGSNVTIENNVLMVTSAVDLQSRVDNAAQGLNEFGFANDITGNVTIPQNDKINIVINGLGKKYDGTITVDGNSRSGGSETLVIKNINFEHSGCDLYFVEQNIAQNYPHNVTVEDCTFKGDGTSVIGGIRYRQGFNNVVKNCTAKDLFLFIWTTSGNNITIDNVDVIGYIEGGFSLGQCNEFTVKNSSIVASNHSGYGIRLSAKMSSTATIENCEISSFIPVMVREASADQVLTFNGQNTMSASNTDNIWCAIGTSAYTTSGTMPTPATGKVTVVLNDTGLNQAGVYGDYRPVAKIGETVYTSLGEAVKASTSTDEIILTDDAELVYTITNPYAPAKTINASVIDLNGKTMTIKDTDLRFNNTTIKNGKIVVAPGTYASTAIFYEHENNNLTFNDVEITATGLVGTYLIGLEGNSNLNLFDSQIIIDNENLVNLVAAVACNGSGSTIVKNSNIYVKNINGRAFLSTSCSVVNSEVTADYVKAGFYIPAGKTLSIDATSIVNITNLVGGNVNGIDLHGNATYNVEDGATVNATVGRN